MDEQLSGQTKCSLPTDITEGVSRAQITEMVRSLASCPSRKAPPWGVSRCIKGNEKINKVFQFTLTSL
jgi:hypothetical protein